MDIRRESCEEANHCDVTSAEEATVQFAAANHPTTLPKRSNSPTHHHGNKRKRHNRHRYHANENNEARVESQASSVDSNDHLLAQRVSPLEGGDSPQVDEDRLEELNSRLSSHSGNDNPSSPWVTTSPQEGIEVQRRHSKTSDDVSNPQGTSNDVSPDQDPGPSACRGESRKESSSSSSSPTVNPRDATPDHRGGDRSAGSPQQSTSEEEDRNDLELLSRPSWCDAGFALKRVLQVSWFILFKI